MNDPDLVVVYPDLTAPESPPNVMRTRFRTGLPGGSGPVTMGGWDANGARYSKLYLSMWMMIEGPDYYQNNNGTKMSYFGYGRDPSPADNEGIFIMNGGGTQHFTASSFGFHFFQGGHIVPVRVMDQNVDTRKLMTCGVWHHWELLLELNTLGQANGKLKVWIDGIRILDYSDVVYITPGNLAGFRAWKWNPTWGGAGGPRIRDDYMRADHVYLSGVP